VHWEDFEVRLRSDYSDFIFLAIFDDRDLLVKAYKTYVRPLLETNSQIWSPHLLKDIRRIEAVQRRFTKKLDGLHSFDYAERLSLLGLKRLEERRIRADLLFAYKLLFGFTPLNVHEFFTPSRCTGTRGHAYKLFLTRYTTDVRKHFFCNRVAKIWNQLPSNTDFTSITSFRRALNGFDLNAYCDCWHLLYSFKRVYNITVFISYLTYSYYIFRGAALVALPCSCRWAALYIIVLLLYLTCYFTCCACSCTINEINEIETDTEMTWTEKLNNMVWKTE